MTADQAKEMAIKALDEKTLHWQKEVNRLIEHYASCGRRDWLWKRDEERVCDHEHVLEVLRFNGFTVVELQAGWKIIW